jgi:hypothetical protein
MLHHPGVVFSKEGDVERFATIGGVMEAELVAERGLPAPGGPWTM